jgi:hypothetical protein
MKNVMMFVALVATSACSSKSSTPAPAISDFTLMSPIAENTTTVTGSVEISDTSGLGGDLTMSISISGAGVPNETLPPLMIPGGSSSETIGTIPLTLKLSAAIPAGSYTISITVSDNGVTSTPLTAPLVVQ